MKTIFVSLLMIFIVGCSRESTISSRPYEGELKKIRDYKIEGDSSFLKSRFNTAQYYYDSIAQKEYFSLLIPKMNKINYYDLSTGQLFAELSICPEADCYYTHNFDSIFVTMNNSTLVKLYDIKGNLIDEYDYKEYLPLSKGKYFSQCVYYSFPFFQNNTLYFRVVNDQNYFNVSGILIMKLKDTKGIEECHLTAPFPAGYEEQLEYYFNCAPVFAAKDDAVFMSFAVEHDVFVFNKSGLAKKIEARSDHLKEFSKDSRKDFKSETAFFNQCAMFKAFAYDKYHNLFYRVAQLEVPPKERKKPEKLMNRKWAFCVFDDGFNKLNEFIVEDSVNNMGCILPTKDGFLAFKSYSETTDEDGQNRYQTVWTLYKYER